VSNKKAPLDFEQALAYRIYRSARLLRVHFHQLAAAQGLTLSQEQWFILNRLRRDSGLTQVELSDAATQDRPNVTRLVAALEASGLVMREADADDGRKQRVHLTTLGCEIHDRFAALVPQARRAILKGVSPDDLATTLRVLSQLESNLS
jgi:DNA-binding MarR family transcriptional regulator